MNKKEYLEAQRELKREDRTRWDNITSQSIGILMFFAGVTLVLLFFIALFKSDILSHDLLQSISGNPWNLVGYVFLIIGASISFLYFCGEYITSSIELITKSKKEDNKCQNQKK